MALYELIVGNIGLVWHGSNGAQALREFGQARASAMQPGGRDGWEPVTLMRDSETLHEWTPGPFWFFEMTDTFGGDANYSWVHRFKVQAPTMRGALRKLAREIGYSGRMRREWDSGQVTRWDCGRDCVCVFGESWDDDSHDRYLHVKEL